MRLVVSAFCFCEVGIIEEVPEEESYAWETGLPSVRGSALLYITQVQCRLADMTCLRIFNS